MKVKPTIDLMYMLPDDIGLRVRYARQHYGLTQNFLEDHCELGRETLSRIERGQSQGSIRVLRKLSRYLDIDPGFFLGFHTNIKAPPLQEVEN